MPIMAAPVSGLIICKRHQGASVPNEGFGQLTLQGLSRTIASRGVKGSVNPRGVSHLCQ